MSTIPTFKPLNSPAQTMPAFRGHVPPPPLPRIAVKVPRKRKQANRRRRKAPKATKKPAGYKTIVIGNAYRKKIRPVTLVKGKNKLWRIKRQYYRNLMGRFCKRKTKGCFKWSRARADAKRARALKRAAKAAKAKK